MFAQGSALTGKAPENRLDHSYRAHHERCTRPSRHSPPGESNGFRGTTVSVEYGIGVSVARRGSLLVVHESLEALANPPEVPLSALTICALDRLSRAVTPSPFGQSTMHLPTSVPR